VLLAHVAFNDSRGDYVRLCVVPDEANHLSVPVWVDLMLQSDASVFWIGPREAVTVKVEQNSKIIAPVPPAFFYLTPDSPNRPGTKVGRVKIDFLDEGHYRVFFAKERDEKWYPWEPVVQLR